MEIVRDFAKSTIRDIERNNGVILDPLETSLALLVAAGRSFWSIVNMENPDFMNLVSRPTQIAIFREPEKFYVPESNNKSLKEQEQLLEVDEAEVIRKSWGIGGLKLVIGDVATHPGLVFAYFDKTGGKIKLHGEYYGYRQVRTDTPTVGSRVAGVGYFYGVDGLYVDGWRRDVGYVHVWAVRLGVPAQE